MDLTFGPATEADAAAIAELRNAVADRLTREHGKGHWSHATTERGVLRGIQTSKVLVARSDGGVVATLRLATKKPWAIDPTRFTPVRRALYLLDMAVRPDLQRRGIGRRLLAEAVTVAAAWPADAVRLDAYDSPAGAGPFYARCHWRPRGGATFRGTPLLYFELLLSSRRDADVTKKS